MSSLKERVEGLEADLTASPMRHYVYHDLPFAIFAYAPDQEWVMRGEIVRLKTRLEQTTPRQVVTISLAELLWQSIEESEGLAAIVGLEQRRGFEAAQRQEILGKPAILLVAGPVRAMLSRFARMAVPNMHVLAYQEIPDNKQVTIVATVGQN